MFLLGTKRRRINLQGASALKCILIKELHNHWTGIYKIPRIPLPLFHSWSEAKWHPQCLLFLHLQRLETEQRRNIF